VFSVGRGFRGLVPRSLHAAIEAAQVFLGEFGPTRAIPAADVRLRGVDSMVPLHNSYVLSLYGLLCNALFSFQSEALPQEIP